MPLILAIEPDRRQAAQLKRLVRGCVGADLVLADTTELALEAIGDRIPDLVLVPALLSPQDDAALATALRVIAAAAHVQTLTIPVFAGTVAPKQTIGGVLAKWRRSREQSASPEGCDPAVFAEQIAAYLAEAAAARKALNAAAEEAADGYDPPAPRPIVEPMASAQSVEAEADAEPWADDELWADAPVTEIALVQATNEPLEAESEPAPTSFGPTVFEPMALEPEPAQPVELAPELLAEPDSEWQPIALTEPSEEPSEPSEERYEEPPSAEGHLLVAGELDLSAFLTELEEKRQEPDAGVEPESIERVDAALIDLDAAPVDGEPEHVVAAFKEDSEPARRPTAETDSWRGLSLAPHRWPRLEGVLAELPRTALAPDAAVAERDVAARAEAAIVQDAEPAREARAASRPESGRSEWLDMLDALRHDMERLRAQRTEAGAPAPIEPVQAATPDPVDIEETVPRKKNRKKKETPVQDEWGFFDPQQCGFTALLAKLDEISSSTDETGTHPQ